ncbi:MAG: SRPBCC family protein [Prevotella sp.]|nr:SRPBCC family protein [Prevotella sp.]
METKFESSIREIPYPQQAVYHRLSDLSLSEEVRNQLPEDKREDIIFDSESITMDVPPVGSISIRICDREEPKTIKYETVSSPLPFNLWVQLLPTSDTSCKMKLTIKADLNMFVKGMISKPLQAGLEKLADAIAAGRYE